MQRPNQPSAQPFEALLIMITAQLLLTVDSLGLCKIAAPLVPVARRHSSGRDALPTTAATANHAGGFDHFVRLS
jgi:hypothetical protein